MQRGVRVPRGPRPLAIAPPPGTLCARVPPLRLCLLTLLPACAAFEPDAPPLTAQRPLLSADTATVAHGEAEVELGTRLDDDNQLDLPAALKLGVGAATELYLEFSPWVHVQHRFDGHSDLLVGARHRLHDGGDGLPELAVQGAVDLPIGDDGAGGGHTDLFLAGIATERFDWTAVTAFYQFGEQGSGGGAFATEHQLAFAVAQSLDQRFGLFGEFAGVWRPDDGSRATVWTFGVTFASSPHTVFDVAVAHGDGDEAQNTALFLGITTNLGAY